MPYNFSMCSTAYIHKGGKLEKFKEQYLFPEKSPIST